MNRLRLSLLFSATVLAGCSGGGPESPDFQPERFVESLRIVDANGNDVPPSPAQSFRAGESREYRAIAKVLTTVPPGTDGAEKRDDGRWYRAEDQPVTSGAAWTSSDSSKASVTSGVVQGKSPGSGVTIKAAFEGASDQFSVNVTEAALREVRDVRPVGQPTSANDSYTSVVGLRLPFEMVGMYEDNVERVIPHSTAHQWTSSVAAVAAKPSGSTAPSDRVFETLSTGSTTIRGEVPQSQGKPAPNNASATLNVVGANEFCAAIFSPNAVVTLEPCATNCEASDDGTALKDGNLETATTLEVPLAILTQSVFTVTIANPQGTPKITKGRPVGFVIGRTASSLVAAELLSNISVSTVVRNATGELVPTNDSATEDNTLVLSLLGQTAQSGYVGLVSTAETQQDFDGIRLTFNGGLVGLLTSLDVYEACPVAVPPQAP